MLDLEDFGELALGMQIAIIASIVLLAALIAGSVVSYFVAKKNGSEAITSRDLAFGGICLALSFALGFIGIHFPQGGTITPASSLPIMVYCYYFGFRKGLAVCIANMLLQFLQSPYIVHPMSAVLDYAIPYLALILFGIFSYNRKKTDTMRKTSTAPLTSHINFFIAAGLYIVVRYCSHVLSGGIFYSEWAWEGWAVWPYSFAYNAFFLADAAIAIIAACFVLNSQTFNRFMTAPVNALQNSNAAEENNQG